MYQTEFTEIIVRELEDQILNSKRKKKDQYQGKIKLRYSDGFVIENYVVRKTTF